MSVRAAGPLSPKRDACDEGVSELIEKAKSFLESRRELIIYYLIGGGTTAVAWGCKYLFNLFLFGGTSFPSVRQNSMLSFVENMSAIAYAYPANRVWVFHSKDPHIFRELILFSASRLSSWIVGWLLNIFLVSVLNVSIFLSTVIVGIICVNVNFALSKLMVFRKKQSRRDGAPS